MLIKLDENMPAGLASILSGLGHDTDTVPSEQLAGAVDDAVWTACQRNRRFLITQDLDFSDIRRFEPGSHHGLLLVRLREPSRELLTERVRAVFTNEDVDGWVGCFLVLTDSRLRTRRPSGTNPSTEGPVAT